MMWWVCINRGCVAFGVGEIEVPGERGLFESCPECGWVKLWFLENEVLAWA